MIKLAFVGCGRLGSNLAFHLFECGYDIVGLNSRKSGNAKKLNQIIGGKIEISEYPWEVTKNADVVFITTPDDKIAEICQSIVDNGGIKPDGTILHCSGSLPSTVLEAAKRAKGFIGSIHPLQSFASLVTDRNPFLNCYMSFEGDNESKQISKKIIEDIGAIYLEIDTKSKNLYHAAAVVASNYLVSLLYIAKELNVASGISEQDSLAGLKPLIEGTLKNIDKYGIPQALTGPIVRGDIKTVSKHLEDIQKSRPSLIASYKALGGITTNLALEKGSISLKQAEGFFKLFV